MIAEECPEIVSRPMFYLRRVQTRMNLLSTFLKQLEEEAGWRPPIKEGYHIVSINEWEGKIS